MLTGYAAKTAPFDLTAFKQQLFLLETEGLTQVGPLNATYDPCTECIKDLKAFIQDLQSKHHRIIFFVDANETECESKY